MRIGYGRVSTRDQNPDGQHDALDAAGCDEVLVDKRPPRRRAALGLPRTTRRPLTNCEVTIRSGLGQLGGASCRLDGPYNIPIVMVPGHPELVAIRRSSPTPIRPSAPVVAPRVVPSRARKSMLDNRSGGEAHSRAAGAAGGALVYEGVEISRSAGSRGRASGWPERQPAAAASVRA